VCRSVAQTLARRPGDRGLLTLPALSSASPTVPMLPVAPASSSSAVNAGDVQWVRSVTEPESPGGWRRR
jgi:hypothetical protein